MTQQEALAQALQSDEVKLWLSDRLSVVTGEPVASVAAVDDLFSDPHTPGIVDELAAAILDALHADEGYDVRPTPTVTVLRERQIYEDGMAHGAQQERGRLRAYADAALVVGDPSDIWTPIWTQREVYLWAMDTLLADPEDDR